MTYNKDACKKYRSTPRGKAAAAAYRDSHKDDRRAYMREYTKNNRERENERARQWREDHPEQDRANKVRYRSQRRQLKEEKVRKAGGCAICGLKYNGSNACVFDLHHINPFQKVKTAGNCRGIPQFKQEAAKCSVVCSNCHRLLHKTEAGEG